MQNVVVFKCLNQLYQDTEKICYFCDYCVNVQLFKQFTWYFCLFCVILHTFWLFSYQEWKNLHNLDSPHSQSPSVRNVPQLFSCLRNKAFKNFLKLEAVKSLNFGMMKIRMQNHAIIPTYVLVFRHWIIDNFVDFWGSVKDGEKNLDDFLVVGDVLLRLDVSWSLFDDFADGIRQIGNDLW